MIEWQSCNLHKQRPAFLFLKTMQPEGFSFSPDVLQDDWLHFISKIPELLIIMRRTFITKKTHYTGSFRICAALWGTFIIFFISKSFLSSRLCGKWVTFISLQIQIVQPRATVLSSECLELFYSRGQSCDSLSEDYLEAFALFSSVGKNEICWCKFKKIMSGLQLSTKSC